MWLYIIVVCKSKIPNVIKRGEKKWQKREIREKSIKKGEQSSLT